MTPLASVRVSALDDVPVAYLEGEVDLSNEAAITRELAAAAANEAPGLVVDLSGTTYLDSKGVYLLLALAGRLESHRQHLRVAVPETSPVRRILVLSQVDRTIPLDSTVDEAVGQIRAGR